MAFAGRTDSGRVGPLSKEACRGATFKFTSRLKTKISCPNTAKLSAREAKNPSRFVFLISNMMNQLFKYYTTRFKPIYLRDPSNVVKFSQMYPLPQECVWPRNLGTKESSESRRALVGKDVREREEVNPIKNKTSEINDDNNTMETEPLTNSLKRNSLSRRYEYNIDIIKFLKEYLYFD